MKFFHPIAILFIAASFVFSACKKDKEKEEETEVVYKTEQSYVLADISYGSEAGQDMDIYLPANRSASTKVFVLVHGGGWHAGDKAVKP